MIQIAALILLFIPCVSIAQDLELGMKGGLNISDVVLNNVVNPDLEAEYKAKTGVHAGVFLLMQFDEVWAFSPELLYSQKGVNAVDTKINLHYAALPLMVKYQLSDNVRVEGGPEIAYLFLAKSKYGNVNKVYNNQLDIAVNVGIEFLLSEKLFLGLRLNAGLSNLVDDPSQASGIKYQNRVMQFCMGYVFVETSK